MFSHELGIHVSGLLRDPATYEVLDPALFGWARQIVLGKHSGLAAIHHALQQLGVSVGDASARNLLGQVRALAETSERPVAAHELLALRTPDAYRSRRERGTDAMHGESIGIPEISRSMALVLGTGDIASAIGRLLFMQGWSVVQLRDPNVPVLRRGMSFEDELDDGTAELDGVCAVRATATEALPALAMAREAVVLATLELAVFAAAFPHLAKVIIDARMRKYATPPNLRPLARCTIGVGPGFSADVNVDVAIETLPGAGGRSRRERADRAAHRPRGGARRRRRGALRICVGRWPVPAAGWARFLGQGGLCDRRHCRSSDPCDR